MKKRYTNGPQPGKGRNHIRSIATLSSLLMLLLLSLASCNVVPRGEAVISPNMVFLDSSRGLTDYVGDIRLSITGAGIDQEWSLSQSVAEIAITLPAADNVRFELEATLGSLLNTGPVLSLGGVLWADLVAGETTVLDFYMSPYETKILVPDYVYSSDFYSYIPRIVQLENLSQAEETWEESLFQNLYSQIWDVELDNFGQIWMAVGGSDSNGIIGINKVPATEIIPGSPTYYALSISVPVYTLTFEKSTGYMYYIYEDYMANAPINIKRITTGFDIADLASYTDTDTFILNKFELTDLNGRTLYSIAPFGLAVDNEGYLYFAGKVDEGSVAQNLVDYIFKVDPDTAEIVAQTSAATGFVLPLVDSNIYDNPDLLFKNGYIYVTNKNSTEAGKIILKFNTDLELVDSFGTQSDTASTSGEFLGPSRFLATVNQKFYVIDERPLDQGTPSGYNRIVSFSDMEGSDWETYMPQIYEDSIYMDNVDRFGFFYGDYMF